MFFPFGIQRGATRPRHDTEYVCRPGRETERDERSDVFTTKCCWNSFCKFSMTLASSRFAQRNGSGLSARKSKVMCQASASQLVLGMEADCCFVSLVECAVGFHSEIVNIC